MGFKTEASRGQKKFPLETCLKLSHILEDYITGDYASRCAVRSYQLLAKLWISFFAIFM